MALLRKKPVPVQELEPVIIDGFILESVLESLMEEVRPKLRGLKLHKGDSINFSLSTELSGAGLYPLLKRLQDLLK